MNFVFKLFEMTTLKQVVLRTIASALLLAILTSYIGKLVWEVFFPGATYPDVYEVQIVTFFIAILVASPVLYGLFFMALRVSLKNQELFELANLDPLTSIFNRRALADHFQMRARKARRNFSDGRLFVADVDKFKLINDTYGHDIGDKVLVHLAKLLSKDASVDCCVARLGGEEFAILQFDESVQSSYEFAENIRKTIEGSPMVAGSVTVHLTVSIGFCDVDSNSTLNSALHQADKALYAAKRSGRNRVIKYDPATPALAPETNDLIHVEPRVLLSQSTSSR